MMTKQFDPAVLYKQLEHLEKEIQIIKWELAQLAPMQIATDTEITPTDNWDALHDAEDVWEREWDAEWESIWQIP